jgi:hypothetical protein
MASDDDTGRRRRYAMSDDERAYASTRRARSVSGEIEAAPEPPGPDHEITPCPVDLPPEVALVWEHVAAAERRTADLLMQMQARGTGFDADEVATLKRAVPVVKHARRAVVALAGAVIAALGSAAMALKNAGARDGRLDAQIEALRHDVDRIEDEIRQLWTFAARSRAPIPQGAYLEKDR